MLLLQAPNDFQLNPPSQLDFSNQSLNKSWDYSNCNLQSLKSKDVEAIRAFTSTILNDYFTVGFFLQFILNKNDVCLFLTAPDNPRDIVAAISGSLEIDMTSNTAKGHIYTLSVDPKCRRLGLGTKLLTEFEAHMNKLATDSLTKLICLSLETKSSNKPARAFYNQLGFISAGTRHRYYSSGEDCIFLTRPV